MKGIARYWPWVPLLALGLVPPLLYWAGRRGDLSYLDGFMGNWLATVLGLVVGVPIGLAVSDGQRRAQAREETARKEREASARRALVLQLISEELTYNAALLSKRALNQNLGDLISAEARTKHEMWDALSGGGDLRCIDDLRLLAIICEAYYRVRARESLGERLGEAMNSPVNSASFQQPEIAKLAARVLSRGDTEAVERVEKALGAIHSTLGTQVSSRPQPPTAWRQWLAKGKEPDA